MKRFIVSLALLAGCTTTTQQAAPVTHTAAPPEIARTLRRQVAPPRCADRYVVFTIITEHGAVVFWYNCPGGCADEVATVDHEARVGVLALWSRSRGRRNESASTSRSCSVNGARGIVHA